MIDHRPVFHLALLVLQADTAHGIHSGRGDNTHDVLLVRDANGLPTIPGSSLAGVLRHAYGRRHGEPDGNQLFGTLEGQGLVSPLSVDWGLLHDTGDQPHEGLLATQTLHDDVLFNFLLQDKPIVRQRVRLNHRGAAEDAGKFDTTLIPAGVRYSHWLGYWCDGSAVSSQRWERLLELIGNSTLQLGHGTRSGNGQFHVHRLNTAHWDLRTTDGRAGYQQRPRQRCDGNGLQGHTLSHPAKAELQVHLQLQADSGWRIGGGEHSLDIHEKEPDLLPQHELRVIWEGSRARLGKQVHLLPGSAIKGALRHRVAYHWRRLQGQWATQALEKIEDCPAIRQLFGSSSGDGGIAGALRINDLHLDNTATSVLMHNRIDRFTGGVIKGGLFSEQVLWQTPFTLKIHLDSPGKVEADARQALQLALQDLACGRLPLGAGGSRGLGSFNDPSGRGPHWTDDGLWLKNGKSTDSETSA